MLRASLCSVVVLFASIAAAEPTTGSVTGTVKVSETNGSAVTDASIVVYVVGPPLPADNKSRASQIVQKNKTFVPDLVAITVGDTVSFPNQDTGLHNVFSPNPKFDLGSLKKGEDGGAKKFDVAGVVDVYCNIHPQMAATILVLPNRFHTATKTGSFELTGIPPGDWTVFAYTRRATKPASLKVKVVGGEKATANLSLVRGLETPHDNKYGGKYSSGYPK